MSGLVKLVNRACALYGSTAARLAKHRVILCYHSVGDAGRGWLGDSRSITRADFEAQMRWLKANTEVVSLDQITRDTAASRRHKVAITFDDGYLNNVETVMPILRELGLPMTWFVTTGFVDDARRLPWWDLIDLLLQQAAGSIEFTDPGIAGVYDLSDTRQRNWLNKSLRAYIKRQPPGRRDAIARELGRQLERLVELPQNAFARAEEIAALDWDGLEIGGHTVTHPNLAACSEAERRDELLTGKRRLEQISGRQLNWFAYPFGGPGTFDAASAASVRESGFRGAVTLVPGTVSANSDVYSLPRLAVSPGMPLAVFRARVTGAPLFALSQRLRDGLSRKPAQSR